MDLTGAYGIAMGGGLRQDFAEDRTGYSDTQQVGSGVFATSGFDGDVILTSLAGNLPLGVPLRINLSMSTSSSVAGTLDLTGSVSGQAAAIFDHTLSFPKDGPVFNLPEGYTANSLDGMIVDNRWTPVPIAPASVFLGTGLLSLLPGIRHRVRAG